MVAVPVPIPPPPVVRPAWDPTQADPYGGPTVGQIWNKVKEAAGVNADSKAEPRVQAQDTDCSQTSNQNECNQCKLAQGIMLPVNYTIKLNQYSNFDYQLQIANMAAAPERFDYTYGGSTMDRTRLRLLGGKNQITIAEWNYSGVGFDGFWRGQCMAVEAKAEYAQFFDDDGRGRWRFVEQKVVLGWIEQKQRQKQKILNAGSPAKLQWHFKHESCYLAARRAFRLDQFICRYTP
ncbi:restriction endonuclease fold toxin 5 domain-containing protein [Xanthomonas translucens]|uniref:Tox-REase-5 domain-containing protein n=1 Tax=Xanthomonas campestris pv. translucens TaxID=343 RepID=UPI001F3D9AAD|nr:Tox-REase-5 domain-containing protein [Xanthomonas translucens]UII65675.1 restriction endonuclease fold toxin 5 domain-containing protein [Xanthomonas translucens]